MLKFGKTNSKMTLNDESKRISALREANAHPSSSKIVLLHGLGGSRLYMWPLARRLRNLGFDVENWGYRSLWSKLEHHGMRLSDTLAEIAYEESIESIYIVAHSLGCIVSRVALAAPFPEKVKLAVFLAPPNQGSPVADFFSPLLAPLLKPVPQLRTHPESFVNQLPHDIGIPFGVIAAETDWMVPASSAHLPTQTDFAVAGGIHSVLPLRKDVCQLIERFIRYQTFKEIESGIDTLPRPDSLAQESPA